MGTGEKREEELATQISAWIRERAREAGAKGVVVGLSGGVDSSTVAVLASRAGGIEVLGLIMPCHSNPEDEKLAWMVVRWLDIPVEQVDLSSAFDQLLAILPPGDRLAQANIKPRLRMITLYHFARLRNLLVAGTGNKSEIMVGYFTKYGDGGVDILPLGNLLKRDVRRLARWLDVPQEIVARTPTAGLWPGQTDEGEMGLTYKELDRAIEALEAGRKDALSSRALERLEGMMALSEHKRRPIPMFQPQRACSR